MTRYDKIGAAHQPGGGRAWSSDGRDQHADESHDQTSDMSAEREHALGRSWFYGDSIDD